MKRALLWLDLKFRSDKFKINEGVKQGGILSSLLFNFFMDGLLSSLLELNVGALMDGVNTSALAYCDDIMLISPVEAHMQKLIQFCEVYANRWKLSFNTTKLFDGAGWIQLHVEWWMYTQVTWFCLPGPAYWWCWFCGRVLPWEDEELREDHEEHRLQPYILHPLVVGFIYKQYCQSILKFGFEFFQLRRSFLSMLDMRQNILLKNILGVHHRARFKMVLNEIKVELYAKHKVFGWK